MPQRDADQLEQEVEAILAGRGHYGTYAGGPTPMGQFAGEGITWIGSPGITASVGAFIRGVRDRLAAGAICVIPALRYSSEEGEGQHTFFYRVDLLGPAWREEGLIVGGCTDYSGEGQHGKELAEHYLTHVLGLPLATRPASYLIELLVEAHMEGKGGATMPTT